MPSKKSGPAKRKRKPPQLRDKQPQYLTSSRLPMSAIQPLPNGQPRGPPNAPPLPQSRPPPPRPIPIRRPSRPLEDDPLLNLPLGPNDPSQDKGKEKDYNYIHRNDRPPPISINPP